MKTSELKKMLTTRLANELSDLADHNQIKEALKLVDGKSFTTKALEKVLNPIGYDFYVHAGMYHAKKKVATEGYSSHLLGYNSNPVVQVDKFDDFDSWAFAGSIGRAEQCKYWLEPENFKTLLQAYNKLEKGYKLLKDAVMEIEGNHLGAFHVPITYEARKSIGLSSKAYSNIQYNRED